jgi:glutathione synthase/RimK-type ligase-like ATP-grasp enzyme
MRNVRENKKNILILRSNSDNKKSIAFKLHEDLAKVGTDNYTLRHYSEVTIKITTSVEIMIGTENINDFDLVYLRDFRGYEPERNTIALYCKNNRIPYVNKDTGTFQHYTKLTQTVALALDNLPTPRSLYMSIASEKALDTICDTLGDRVIAKGISARKGEDNFLLKNRQELKAFLAENIESDNKFIFQSFVPNKWDFRVIIVGGTAAKTYKRERDPSSDKHQNNMAQGGAVFAVEKPDKKVIQLAEAAAISVNRQICGVDVLENSTDGSYVLLEINDNSDNFHVDPYSEEIIRLSSFLHKEAR